jgi:hypothetical protein
MKKIAILIAVLVLLVIIGFLLDWGRGKAVSTFDECVAAGFPVMESYPPRCTDADGNTFTQIIGSRDSKAGLIVVDNLPDGAQVTSPIQITGKARGPWFFEASFPIALVDEDGTQLAIAIATAQGEWMTTEFVPFTATLLYASSTRGPAKLVFMKDNPSGMPEFDDSLVVPVVLK